MSFIFLTNNGCLVEKYSGTSVELVRDIPQTNEAEVRFFDHTTATVKRSDLYAPDRVPFKVGDKVKNLNGFALSSGAWAWSGITWEVKSVTYSLPNLSCAILVCDSKEVALWDKVFTDEMVEKV